MITDQRKELHSRAVEWYEENQPNNFTILALHTERAQLSQKNVHYLVLAAEDALARSAPSQSCRFFEEALKIATGLKENFVTVSSGKELHAKKKKNQVDAILDVDAAVQNKNPDPQDVKWLLTMEVHLIRRLSRSHSLVRRHLSEICSSHFACFFVFYFCEVLSAVCNSC
jgi:hypothetical protein